MEYAADTVDGQQSSNCISFPKQISCPTSPGSACLKPRPSTMRASTAGVWLFAAILSCAVLADARGSRRLLDDDPFGINTVASYGNLLSVLSVSEQPRAFPIKQAQQKRRVLLSWTYVFSVIEQPVSDNERNCAGMIAAQILCRCVHR